MAGTQDHVAQPQKRGCGFWIGIGLAVIVGLAVLGAIADPAPRGDSSAADPEVVAAAPALEVSAAELAAAYQANEVAAQQQYGGQVLVVTGTVQAIELDFMDEPVVRLDTGEPFGWVSAYFGAEHTGATAQLSRGQEVRLRCAGVREVVGMAQLDDCALQ